MLFIRTFYTLRRFFAGIYFELMEKEESTLTESILVHISSSFIDIDNGWYTRRKKNHLYFDMPRAIRFYSVYAPELNETVKEIRTNGWNKNSLLNSKKKQIFFRFQLSVLCGKSYMPHQIEKMWFSFMWKNYNNKNIESLSWPDSVYWCYSIFKCDGIRHDKRMRKSFVCCRK